jgi:uncharacterized membrane protein
MGLTDTEKKAQYKQYSFWMIIIGIILVIAGSYLLGDLFKFFGVILGGAGIIVLLTNWK